MALSAQNPPKTLTKILFPPSVPRPNRLAMPRRPPLPTTLAAASPGAASLLAADSRHRDDVLRAAGAALSNCLSETHLDRTVPGLRSKIRGKVRDIYDGGEYLVLVTTDRQSAFDMVLASIPFKGQPAQSNQRQSNGNGNGNSDLICHGGDVACIM